MPSKIQTLDSHEAPFCGGWQIRKRTQGFMEMSNDSPSGRHCHQVIG